MKKKNFGRFTAIGLAAITAVPAFSMVASAATANETNAATVASKFSNASSHTIYGTIYSLTQSNTTYYFTTESARDTAYTNNGSTGTRSSCDITSKYSVGSKIYVNASDEITNVITDTLYYVIPASATVDPINEDTRVVVWGNVYGLQITLTTGTGTSKHTDIYTLFFGNQNDLTTAINVVASTTNKTAGFTYKTYTADIKNTSLAGKTITFGHVDPARIKSNGSVTVALDDTTLNNKIASLYALSVDGSGLESASYEFNVQGAGSTTNISTSDNFTGGNTNNTIVTNGYTFPTAATRYASSNGLVYYVSGVGYYPNAAAAISAGYSGSYSAATPVYGYSSARPYFCYTDGNYYSSTAAAGYDTYYVYADSTLADNTTYTTPLYYNATTARYYLSYAEAYNAGGTTSIYGTYVAPNITTSSTTTRGYYFNYKTGKFYDTYSDAVAAASSSTYIITASSIDKSSYTGDSGDYTNTNGTYNYLDPYYYYFMNQGTGTKTNTNTSTSTVSTSGTDAATIVNGKAVYGMSGVATAINAAKAGSTVSVAMNETTSLTKSVISAAKTKGVTLKLTMGNGSVVTIDGNDVTSAKTINLEVTYNTKNIPTTLVSKATKGAVSKAEITIGDNKALGLTADITVKFSSSRAGKTATLYRYDTSKGTLVKVDSAKIGSNGSASFSVDAGGDFLAVIS